MSASMTYASLVADIKAYCERPNDTNLSDQIPRLVMMAENRIAVDARILGTRKVAEAVFSAGNPVVAKPAFWRRTETFRYTNAEGDLVTVWPRTYGFCTTFWTDLASTGQPRYYADYDYDNFFVVAPPAAAYAFQILYIARLAPLDDATQTNWLTANAPQLLLYATLEEAGTFLRNTPMAALYAQRYGEALKAFKLEDATRKVDDSIVIGVA